jgi:23S rRNA (cytidine1920-2'-O)/16S rRNA (cytidine1409-2'-O)-methyltransferase
VSDTAATLGWLTGGVCRSPLPGPSGNVEFFLWLRRGVPQPLGPDDIARIVTTTEAQ